MMSEQDTVIVEALFDIGELIRHKFFGYRGLIFDADPYFMFTDEWYDIMAPSLPSKEQPWYHVLADKEQPWYHVLADNANYTTYIPECNLVKLNKNSLDYLDPIHHPNFKDLFSDELRDGHYRLLRRRN